MYFPLIFVVVMSQMLKIIYDKAAQNIKIQHSINLNRKEYEEISKKYVQNRDSIYPVYVYLVLLLDCCEILYSFSGMASKRYS